MQKTNAVESVESESRSADTSLLLFRFELKHTIVSSAVNLQKSQVSSTRLAVAAVEIFG